MTAKADSAVRLDRENLLDQARRKTGLSDFGDPWFLGPLDKLIELINTEAGLVAADAPPVGLLVDRLVDRLRLARYLHRHPEVRDERVEVAGFIIGWPRGGSTLLQRLLASSPQLTAPCWWELLNPLPLDDEPAGDPSPRKQLAAEAVAAIYDAWPNMRAMHPLRPLDADEEVMLFERGFMSLMWPQYFYIPSYMAWLQEQDQTAAYADLKLWLQVLTHQQPERRGRKWLLKSPQHLLGGALRTALAAMPEAKAIMTHRSLQNVATSYSSLAKTTLGDWSANADVAKIGRDTIKLFGRSVDHLSEIREDPALDARFVDVRFKDTVERPIEVFRSVMEQMGLTVGDTDVGAAERWMAANGRETHPPHAYSPEDYGMTAVEIDSLFSRYHDKYVR